MRGQRVERHSALTAVYRDTHDLSLASGSPATRVAEERGRGAFLRHPGNR